MDIRADTVDAVVRRSARRTPDRTARLFADRSWTYRELDEATSRTAGWLRSLDVAQGDRVATYGRNSDAYLLSFLGAARLGAIHVPINYALTGEELAYGELITHATGRLAKFKVPKSVHLVDELPRNQSGKLLKRVLREKV